MVLNFHELKIEREFLTFYVLFSRISVGGFLKT